MKRLLAIAILILMAVASWGQDAGAVLKEFSGKVEVMLPGGAWKPAVKGMAIPRNASVSTGFKSLAVLALGSSSLTVKPLTKLTLEEIAKASGNETITLYLNAGRVSAKVAPPAGGSTDFSVKSPSATASVRGTEFDFDSFNLEVSDGMVVFFGADGQAVTVSMGGSSSVGVGGSALTQLQSAYAELAPLLPAGIDEASFASLVKTGGDLLVALAAAGVRVTLSW